MGVRHQHKALGIVFLCLLLGGVWLTYGVFTKKFTDYEEVTLKTSKIGLQLPMRADVKIRGVLVGEVLHFDTDAEGAVLTLGIYPDKLDTIPANVTGSIIPKTLFGEKYVSLEIPERRPGRTPSSRGPRSRAPRSPSRSRRCSPTSTRCCARSAPPTSTPPSTRWPPRSRAGASAIGENLETFDAYLQRVNPQIPDIVEDLRLTSRVSDVYVDVLPEIAQILRDTVRTTGTLEGREAKLEALFQDVASFSDTARTFLDDNEGNIIRLGQLERGAAAAAREVRPGIPLPAGRHRQGRGRPGRGVPRLHAAHRAGDAAEPAPRVRPWGSSWNRSPRVIPPANGS